MIFEKIENARVEMRRLYEPGLMPVLALFAALTVLAVSHREWIAAAVGTFFVVVAVRGIVRNDYRWRATDEPE